MCVKGYELEICILKVGTINKTLSFSLTNH